MLILAVALSIYSFGLSSIIESGVSFTFLIATVFGVLIAELLKIRNIGKHLTVGEVLCNTFVVGILAKEPLG